ncbi:VP1 [Norovirus GII]|uniref:VP1 n=1 Tax=Norovirus GII TaxID=122929 RepID=A0A2L0E8B1_NORV|nr:VP1 [Norovirus GII]AUX13646.1 VP1 [Norovirus GII]
MKMASNDAAPSNDGAANLVPEANSEALALEPVAGGAIAAPLTGQTNIIDPWIMKNFVQAPNGEFTISPRNSPGEILLNLELGPEINPFLAHLSRMYNGFAGGVEVQVLMAGNAFTAGKVIFAAVPPHFPVENISPPQITMFPHIIVDVRTLEPIFIPVPDVRNNFFHYNQMNDPKMRLIAMLYTPLRSNGSSDDVFTVSCRVLTRPTPDFEFNYLVPPTVESRTKPFSVPILTIGEMTNSRFPLPIDMLYTSPTDSLVVQPQNGRCTIEGELQGTTQLVTPNICSLRGAITGHEGNDDNHKWHMTVTSPNGAAFDPTEDVPAPLGTPDFIADIYGVLSQRNRSIESGQSGPANRSHEAVVSTRSPKFTPKLGSVMIATWNTNDIELEPTKFTPIGLENPGPFQQWRLPNYSGALTLNMGLASSVFPTYPGEQILFFRSYIPLKGGFGNTAIDCLVPQEWVQHFYQESAPAQSDVALLRYVNPETGRVLFEAKLHRQGFLTVARSGESPINVPANGYFRFDSWVNQFYSLAPMGTGNGRRRFQ